MKKLKFLLFVLTIFFISCEKDKFEGPMLDNPNVEFAILELDVLGQQILAIIKIHILKHLSQNKLIGKLKLRD